MLGAAILSTLQLLGETGNSMIAKGYVTATHFPDSFDVNGTTVAVSAGTRYGFLGGDTVPGDKALREEVRVGAYVKVAGTREDAHTKALNASVVSLRDDWDRKLMGIGVIAKVLSIAPDFVFRADGYTIRITAATVLAFSGDSKSLSSIGTNCRLQYQGIRDDAGVLVASKVNFLSSKPVPFNTVPGMELDELTLIPAPSRQPAAKPGHKQKLRYADSDRRFHEVDDDALQARIQRIGLNVVPAFQRSLPDNHPSKIQFKFAAVEELGVRSEICSPDGLILVPREVVERLKSDDQLASILADGVAANLQRQAVRVATQTKLLWGAEAAADLSGLFVPGLGLAIGMTEFSPRHHLWVLAEEQRGRIALALMADAGYDLREAPEAWRLLEPRKLPSNLDTLKYPDRSGYMLGILNLQYRGSNAKNSPTIGTAAVLIDPKS